MEQIRRVMRPTDVPDQGLLCDLLWADPDKDVLGWGENDRGVSFTFGADVVAKFLHKHDMDLICRAHQVISQEAEHRWKLHGSHLSSLISSINSAMNLKKKGKKVEGYFNGAQDPGLLFRQLKM